MPSSRRRKSKRVPSSRIFSPGETAALHELDAEARVPRFFALWTRKEAVLKARGEGLPGLDSTVPDDGWLITDLDAAPGYAAAVAHKGDELNCWQWPGDDL